MKKLFFLFIFILLVGCDPCTDPDPITCDTNSDCTIKYGVMIDECKAGCFNGNALVDKECTSTLAWEKLPSACECLDNECSFINEERAIEIVKESSCGSYGEPVLLEAYNVNTDTIWVEMDIDKPGCKPACVISKESVDINWRCSWLEE